MTLEQKFDALAAYVLADSPEQKEATRKALNAIMHSTATPAITGTADIEDVIHQFLMEIGAKPALIGYKMVVWAIQKAIENPELIDSLYHGFYPLIALKFDTTPSRAERAIRHVIEEIWSIGNPVTLTNYFGFSITSNSGKPTNGNFLARSAIIVRSRLKK